MKAKHIELAARLLKDASSRLKGYGLDDEFFSELTDEEKIALGLEFYIWNNGKVELDDYNEADDAGKLKYFKWIGDTGWMHFFADKLLAELSRINSGDDRPRATE